MNYAMILAAGKGTRMKSEKPKVLHEVGGKPMVERILEACKNAGADRVVAIVGYRHDLVEKALDGKCEFALQEPQLGTGHAVMCASQLKDEVGKTLVINGDCPCIQASTLKSLYEALESCDMAVLTVELDDPKAYGRIVRNTDGSLSHIQEFKDCSEKEKKIKEINTGIYCFDNQKLFEGLNLIQNNNAQKEYYITDLVKIFQKLGYRVQPVLAKEPQEVQGVNDLEELEQANSYIQSIISEID